MGISPDFSTEKNRSILILTCTCWQEISLSNTVELTTVHSTKAKVKVKVQVYSLVPSAKRHSPDFTQITPCSQDLFVHKPSQLPGEHTARLLFFGARDCSNTEAFTVLPGTHLHLGRECTCEQSALPRSTKRQSAGCQTETGTYIKTKRPNHGASRDLLRVGRQWNLWNFRKLAKNDV